MAIKRFCFEDGQKKSDIEMKNLSNGDVIIPVEAEKESETTDDEKRNGTVQSKGKVRHLKRIVNLQPFKNTKLSELQFRLNALDLRKKYHLSCF